MKTIILAGGQSSRMGENKALLPVGGVRVIDRIFNELASISKQMIIVTNEGANYSHLHATILQDEESLRGQGPLAGIYTGLAHVKCGPCLIVACDMPFVSKQLAKQLINHLNVMEKEAVVPTYHQQIHPLFAAYDARIYPKVMKTLTSGRRAVRALFDKIDIDYMEIQDDFNVWNMNTPKDYLQVKKMAKELMDDGL